MANHPNRRAYRGELETVAAYIWRMTHDAAERARVYTIEDALECIIAGERIERFVAAPRQVSKYMTDSGSWERGDVAAREGDYRHFWAVEAIGADLGGALNFGLRRDAERMAKHLNTALAALTDDDWRRAEEAARKRRAQLDAEVIKMRGGA